MPKQRKIVTLINITVLVRLRSPTSSVKSQLDQPLRVCEDVLTLQV